MSTKVLGQKPLVFKRFHIGLGGSNEPPKPPLDLLQLSKINVTLPIKILI